MSLRFKQELADLTAEFGITTADLTADELEMLFDACRRLDNPFSSLNAQLMDRPFFIAPGVYAWPITTGAIVWLEEFAAKWWKPGTGLYAWAQLYAVTHAREPLAFSRLTCKADARAAILATALKLTISGAEMQRILEFAYGIEHNAPPTRKELARLKAKARLEAKPKKDFAALVARLEVASGIPLKSWLWERSYSQVLKAYTELYHLAAAAQGRKAPSSDTSSELDEAIANLARVRALIAERLESELKPASKDL